MKLRKCVDYQEWQPVQFADNSYVLRQNKCSNYEAPFVYFFVGSESGLLIDTGATVEGGEILRTIVRSITDLPVLVAHTHGHGDHRLGDPAFQNKNGFTLVSIGPDAVQSKFGFSNWPNNESSINLGEREIRLLPIPGHASDDLAFYDYQSSSIITGDSLYPGRLYVRDWSEYRSSMIRLSDWVQNKPIIRVLGTHIEMSTSANEDFSVGTTYQPNEHKLGLGLSDISAVRQAMEKTPGPERIPLGSYIIWPL